MKVYKFKFSVLIKRLVYLLIALCAVCSAFAVYRGIIAMISPITVTSQDIIGYVASFGVGVFGIVVAVSMLKKSQYELKDNELKTRFGIIVSTYSVSEITGVHLFTKTKKLAVYFKGDKYITISLQDEWYEEFIKDLQSVNKRIVYDESYEEKYE